MRLSLLLLVSVCCGCASLMRPNTEVMFQQHVVFVKALPGPEEGVVVATGVNENRSAHRMLDLLSPEGVALIREKARNGTIEERVIATRLYAWYVGAASHADHENCTTHTTPTIVKLSKKCAALVDEATMIELHTALKPDEIPNKLNHLYAETDRFVRDTVRMRTTR